MNVRLIIAIGMVFFSLFGAVFGSAYAKSIEKELLAAAQEIMQVQTGDDAKEKTEKLLAIWDEKEKNLSIFVQTEGMEKLSTWVESLYRACLCEDLQLVLAQAASVVSILVTLIEEENFSLYNLF